ncbi:MAG: BNR-4 repeat-containing protein, partial [Phycisphaerales bacterium]|nr:BNR-4 repeat-containing protein [Phycisphaerales bacterium]
AAWLDYWGDIDGAPVGVAIFDHPANPRFPTWWHAREYGLIAANPFGRSAFEGGGPDRGRLVVPTNLNLSFQYRFVFHRFSTDEARVKDAYAAWSAHAPGDDWTAGEAIRLNDDGGWCWFEGERAFVIGDTLAVGSIAAGVEDAERRGDVELTLWNLATGDHRTLELADRFQVDDHDQPGLCALDDGRLLALWSRHGPDNSFSGAVVDPTSGAIEHLSPIVPSDSSRVTYSNVYRLSAEGGRLYSFFRGLDNSWKPSYMTSDDGGVAWRPGNVVIDVPTTQKHRPYVRYASNGRDQIHMLYTEGHPRNFDNSVYHVVYSGGQLRSSDGTPIAPLATGLASPDQGTLVFKGDPDHVAWVSDLRLDGEGNPVAVFSVQVGSAGLPQGQGGDDHRTEYARWDGSAWQVHEIGFAGSRLYAGEDDYTGLAAIDPADTSTIYLSTNADPRTGAPLRSRADGNRHWELFKGQTADGGATWEWGPLTANSSCDNLRPIAASGPDGKHLLLWLRGRYRAYTDFDQDVMAMVIP